MLAFVERIDGEATSLDFSPLLCYYMSMKRAIIITAILTLVAGAAGGVWLKTQLDSQTAAKAAQEQPQSTPEPSKYDVGPPDPQEILELVNAERAKVGVVPLVVDPRLVASAQEKADDMQNRDYHAHVSPDGVRGVNIAHRYTQSTCANAGENLGWSTDKNFVGTSRDAFDWWMGSESHRKAIQDARYVTTGIATNQDIAVQHFCATSW